jgi:MFS family permease
VSRQRLAVSIAFLAFGAVAGSWVPRLPAIKDHLHLSDGQVGYALLAFAVGAVLGAGAARLVLARGARRWVRGGTVALCAALIGPALAGNFVWLLATLLLLGLATGLVDVLENAQAAELERLAARPLINGFHGFWSLGGIVGAVLAAIAAYAGVSPLPQFIFTAVVAAGGSALFLRDLPDTRSGAHHVAPSGAGRMWLTGSVFAVAVIAFATLVSESGTADWSSLYLRDVSHASPGVAAAGYAGFSLAMTLVRFRADLLTAHTSPATVARLGGLIAAGGLVLTITVPSLPGAISGIALVGIGTAVLFPLAVSAAANLGKSGTALTLVMAGGYAGSILGPTVIGNAADHVGLRIAFAIPLAATLVIIGLAGSLHARAEKVMPSPSRR